MLHAFEAVHRVFKMRGQRLHALHHVFFHQQVQRSQAHRARHGVRRVGVAVGKLQHVVGAALGHEGVVNVFAGQHCAHGLHAVGDLLGHVHDVGRHAKVLGAGVSPQAAKAGDDLVKNQQDVVGGANLAQALQVALGRNHHAGRARHGLHNHRRNVGRIVQRNQAQQIVGQLGAFFRHAAREGVAGQLGVGQVVGFNALAKHFAVGHNAAHRDAAKVDAVVALFAPDQAGFAGLALGAPVGAGHFQGGVG